MTYTTDRAARSAELLERFNALLFAGESSGYWTTLPDEYAGRRDMEHMARHRQVRTDAGMFGISLNERDGRADASVASVSSLSRQQGIRVHPGDCRVHVNPSASVSLERPAQAAALDLHRRVMVPGADAARWCAAKLAEYVADREALVAARDAAQAAGVKFRDDDLEPWRGEHYEVKGWHTALGSLRITCRGDVYVERLTVGVADLGALAAMVKR